MDGDEMTRVLWADIKEQLILPFVDLKTEYYDLGLPHRDETQDQVTDGRRQRDKKYGVAVKCATITPNAQRVEEYNLHEMWKTPTAPSAPCWTAPCSARPSSSTASSRWSRTGKSPSPSPATPTATCTSAPSSASPAPARRSWCSPGASGEEQPARRCFRLRGAGVCAGPAQQGRSIRPLPAAASTTHCREAGLWFSTKDTISKKYDHTFKDIFQEVYDAEYKEKFERRASPISTRLIDDIVARVIRSKGGFIWACKNYDGDVMSDMVSTAFGSLAMMTSVLVSPDGNYEYEAAHGTVTRHYYKYLKGEKTSTNPMATIFAWSGALRRSTPVFRRSPTAICTSATARR